MFAALVSLLLLSYNTVVCEVYLGWFTDPLLYFCEFTTRTTADILSESSIGLLLEYWWADFVAENWICGSSGNQSWVEYLVLVFINVCNAHDINNYMCGWLHLLPDKMICLDFSCAMFLELYLFGYFFFQVFHTVMYVFEAFSALVMLTRELT